MPGIRPGKNTADYLDYVLTRLTVIGADLPLGGLHPARDPDFRNEYHVPFYFGGTSLLIVVSVTMDTVAQVPVAPARPSVRRRSDQEGEATGVSKGR